MKKHPLPYVPPAQVSLDKLGELQASWRRQEELMDQLVKVSWPEGLTANEFRAVARRFASLAEQAGPRRGLCRFGRAA